MFAIISKVTQQITMEDAGKMFLLKQGGSALGICKLL
jgi:hypothetical protein